MKYILALAVALSAALTGSAHAAIYLTGTISATNFVGSGAGLTNLPASVTDRTISGTTQAIAYSNTSLSLVTAGVERMVIGTTGLVGIGQQPVTGQALSINGDTTMTGALNLLDSTYYTVAVGTGALRNNNSSNNVGIGYYAGLNNKGGSSVVIGYQAGISNTGSNLIAIGTLTATSNSGIYNTAIGYGAVPVTTGSYNVGVGPFTIGGSSSGGGNVAMGYSTGANLSSGASNTLLGWRAGYSLSTGSNNLAIGTNSALNSNNGSNQLSIANTIYGDTSMKRIGINVTSPTTTLEVGGILSATSFVGDGSGLTNIGAALDRISTSAVAAGATLGAVVADKGTVSFTLAGTAGAAYLHATAGLVAPAVSTTTGNVAGLKLIASVNDSAAAPGFTWSGNTNTGMFQAGTNTIGFSTNGTESMRILSSGYVGVGTSTPTVPLQISGTTQSTFLKATGGAGAVTIDASSITADTSFLIVGTNTSQPVYIRTSNTTAMAITANNYVGLGTNTPSTSLHVYSGTDVTSAQDTGYLIMGPANGAHMALDNNEIEAYGPGGTSTTLILNSNLGGNVSVGGDFVTSGYIYPVSTSTAGFPQYAFNGDADTGMWRPSANVLAFATGGSERVRFSGSTLFMTAGTDIDFNAAPVIGLSNINENVFVSKSYPQILVVDQAPAGGTARGTLTARYNDGSTAWFIGDNSSVNDILKIQNQASNTVAIYTSGTLAMNVASNGVTTVYGTTTCTIGVGASVSCSSDRRLKDHIEPLQDSLERIIKLTGVTYNLKKAGNNQRYTGLIAQDVLPYFPNSVAKDHETGYYSIDYGSLVPPLIESIKTLKAENDTLKAQNADILKRLEALEKRTPK